MAPLPRPTARRIPAHGWSIDSRRSLLSSGSDLSVLSVASQLSALSAGCLLSLASAGSILSVGSAGSILSVGSVGSILSVGSAFSIRGRGVSRSRHAQCTGAGAVVPGRAIGLAVGALALISATVDA